MMDSRYDRTLIAPLFLSYFPDMAKATSDEWNGRLNAEFGLNISVTERNANAFDAWRKAAAQQRNWPVWKITPEKEAAIKARGEQLKNAAKAVVEAQPKILAMLGKEAPQVTAAQMVEKHQTWLRRTFKV